MVDSDTDSISKDSNVNCQSDTVQTSNVVVKRKTVTDEPLRTSSQSLPPSNTQIPGQFNYHPQQYKRIPEDNNEANAEQQQQHKPHESTNVLSCYKESPPSLLTDGEKKQTFYNGNSGGGGGGVGGIGDSASDAEKFGSSVTVNTTAHISKADFEQAIELTGYGKFHYLLLAICGLVSTSEEMDVISMSFILPSAQCDLDLNTQTKGWLNSIIFIGMMVGAYVWGSIADTVGRRKVLIVISFMNAVCIVASSFSQTYSLFMIFRFLNGVA